MYLKGEGAEKAYRSLSFQIYFWKELRFRAIQSRDGSLPIRHPNIFYLDGMLKEPAAFALLYVKPVNGAALVSEDLLEISNRERLRGCGAGFVGKAPDGIDVVVFGERLQKLALVTSNDIHCAAGQIAGVEKLIQIAGDQRIGFRRDRNRGIAHRDHRHYERQKSEQRCFIWTDDRDGPDRFVHCDGDIAERRVMHRALKLVSPGSVGKDALDSGVHFGRSLSLSNRRRESARDLITPLRKVLRHVIKNLCAIVGCPLTPTRSFTRRLNCITNVFSVAQRHFAEQPSIPVAHFHAVAGIRARLLASDVELHRSVNRR